MSLRPFFSYYGGKWYAARHYPEPRHPTIVEPFAGSAGYSLRYYGRSVVLVERYAVVAGVWKWLLTATPKQILALPDIQEGQTVDDLDVEPAVRSLIGFWCNAATERPRRSMSKWGRNKSASQLFWGERVRLRLAEQVPAIRHWTVIEGDYTEAPNVKATWFVDPPYNNRVGRQYVHAEIDYARLGAWCRSRSGQVLVCENEGADWLPFQWFRESRGQVKQNRVKMSREVLWTSGS